MTAFRKWALRFLAALLTLGVLVAIAFLVVIRTQWARDSMRKLIVEQTERATGGKVQIGKFDFDALRLEFSVRDFVLRGKEPSSDPPLAHVAGIRAGVTVVSFFRRDAYLAVLEVDRPNIRIVTYPDGSTNIPGPKVRTGPTVFERFVSLSARKFFLKDGLFIYDGRRFPLDLRAEKLSVQFSAELDGPRYRGVVSAAPFHFHYRKIGAVQVDAGVRLTMDKAGLVFEEARIRKGTSNIQASGWMKDYRSPKVEVDAIADIAVADFKNLFRLPVAPEGRVAYKGKLTADEHGPELTGVAHGTALAVRQPLWAITGIEVRSTLALTKDLAQFRDIAGEALGGSFQGEASIRNWRTFDITGAIADLALEEMEVLGQTPRPLAWSSTVSGPVSVSGNLSPEGASNLAVSTNLAFQPSEGKTPLAGSLSLQYRQDPPLLSFAPSYLKTPRTRVDFRGEPNQRMSVRVDSADLNDFLPAAALFSENAPAELPIQLDGGAARFEGTILNPLKDPRIEGSVSLSRFVAGKRAFDSASAKVTVDAARLTAQDLKVEQRGAHV
ncbi:MAG: hypothetical protein HYZ37_03575, partial [Candidatus Solibacter usitatus]|nr:hypothetical protein [Candidatus Solibacter usitatus]